MLNHNILTCAKAEIEDVTVCTVVNGEKISKSCCDLDLDQTMANVRVIFIYYLMLKFQVD